MPSNSELVCWLCLRCGLLFSGPFTLSEPVGCVSGFDYGEERPIILIFGLFVGEAISLQKQVVA